MSEVAKNCLEIAKDKDGCCLLQRHCMKPGQGPLYDHIIQHIIIHALDLSEHEYGNYVVQYLVGMENNVQISTQVVKTLKGNFVYLSKNKFGSHVVEKCLKEADDERANLIITEIFHEPDSNEFLEILQHPMGNFVAQTALGRSKEMLMQGSKWSTYQRQVKRVVDNYAFLHCHMYGKRVLSYVKCNKNRAHGSS